MELRTVQTALGVIEHFDLGLPCLLKCPCQNTIDHYGTLSV